MHTFVFVATQNSRLRSFEFLFCCVSPSWSEMTLAIILLIIILLVAAWAFVNKDNLLDGNACVAPEPQVESVSASQPSESQSAV